MASETLSFEQDEITHMLSQVNISSDFLQTSPSELKSRDLERESRRLLNYELHCVTLAEYLKVQRIPRGLRIRTRPTFFKDDAEFCNKFERILNKCSFDLIALTLSYLQEAITKTKGEIKTIEEQLTAVLPADEFQQLHTKIESSLQNHKKEVESTKRNKFLRDTEDYRLNRVYKWPDPTNSTNSRYRYRSQSRDSSHSGSEGDPHSQQDNYTQHSFRGRRRNQGRTATTTRRPPNMTTRSQAI
ncbi:uncharacterized protein LOC120999044 [Bufo bufo]|uniref:uncharacterized protein LOC120999044 n=1 Tax=Bufo bufo TaxID=8384 RepID=UPI001ABE4973|nr:uncharacterized protein LOC120999044 [Bufo bufo]